MGFARRVFDKFADVCNSILGVRLLATCLKRELFYLRPVNGTVIGRVSHVLTFISSRLKL